jgi:hypothetical protein
MNLSKPNQTMMSRNCATHQRCPEQVGGELFAAK